MNKAPPSLRTNFAGWLLAYVDLQGPVSLGYIGKFVSRVDGILTLDDAFGVASIIRPGAGGEGTRRTMEPYTLESSPALHTVRVQARAEFDLGELSPKEIELYARVQQQATMLRGAVTFEEPLIKMPVGAGALVDANGRPVSP